MSVIYGNPSGGFGMPKTFVLTDDNGNELTGVCVDNLTIFDATTNDVREGKTYAGDEGVKVGTKNIPNYHTTAGYRFIPANIEIVIPLPLENRYDYTELQAMIMPYNTGLVDSVAVNKTVIEGNVYDVGSTIALSSVVKDSENKSISLGITNGSTPSIIRYFTYKEEE